MKKVALIMLIGIIGIAINWLALLAGWWWLTPIIGLAIGLLLRPAGVGFLTSLCAGGLGWGLPLAVLAANAPVGRVANAVEGIVGLFSTGGVAILVLTIALGCILSVLGTWVGVAGRRLPASA
jgi:hypothetical protein